MEHPDIDQASLIDRYVQGTLPAEQRGAFEEHFVDCERCLEQLESAHRLKEALRLGAKIAPSLPVVPVERPRVRRPRWARFAAAASVALALAPSALLYRELARTRGQLEGSRRALATVLNAEISAPAAYVLNQTRGGGGESTAVNIPPPGQWLILLLQLDLSGVKTASATLSDGSGTIVWHTESLQPTSADVIAISLPAKVLRPGEYTLKLQGIDFSFRAGVPTAAE